MVKISSIVFVSCIYGIACSPQMLLAATMAPICTTAICQVMGNFPDINAWLIAIFTFLGLLLRASADLLGFASKALAKSDSGWGQRLSDLALFCSKVVGWFGGGVPKVVLENKIEQASKAVDSPAPSVETTKEAA